MSSSRVEWRYRSAFPSERAVQRFAAASLAMLQSGGTTDRDQIQPAMIQERLEVSVGLGRVLLRKPGDFRLLLP